MFIFTSCIYSVRLESIQALRVLMDETPSILETFDIKYTGLRGRENASVDVRVKFAGHKATLLLAKKDEVKTIVFDVLNLHR